MFVVSSVAVIRRTPLCLNGPILTAGAARGCVKSRPGKIGQDIGCVEAFKSGLSDQKRCCILLVTGVMLLPGMCPGPWIWHQASFR